MYCSKLTISTVQNSFRYLYFNISTSVDNSNFLVQYRNKIIIENMPTHCLIINLYILKHTSKAILKSSLYKNYAR